MNELRPDDDEEALHCDRRSAFGKNKSTHRINRHIQRPNLNAADSVLMFAKDTTNTQDSSSARSFLSPLVIAYVIYVPLAIVLIFLTQHKLNPDGVAYVRIAGYYAELDFDLAVTGYWAPLLSWLLVPWHLLGANPVLGGHVISAVSGALFIAAVHYLVQLFRLSGPIAWAMPVSAGLLALSWQGRGVLADILLAALITLYLAHSYTTSKSLKKWDAAWTGIIAGFAYLAKSYALPFFMLHHSLAVLLVARRSGTRWPDRQQVSCWLVGVAACFLIAGPWIGVLSTKYGRPTFATTGKYAHAYDGPHSNGHWPIALAMPREGRVSSWENPDEAPLPWPTWSPVGSMREAIYQLRLFRRNAWEVARVVFSADGLGLMYVAMIAMPLLACVPRGNMLGIEPWQWRWAFAAVAAYVSGFMFVWAGSGRYYWPLQGLLLVLVGLGAIAIASAMAGRHDRHSRLGSPRLWGNILAVVIVGSCASPLAQTARAALGRPGLDLERIAKTLDALGVGGPVASNHRDKALVIAYHIDIAHLGVPTPESAKDVVRQLAEVGARTFLLFEEDYPEEAAGLSALLDDLGPPVHTVTQGDVSVRVYDVGTLASQLTQTGLAGEE